MKREEEISLIAYHIWEEENCCHGRHIEHWLKAEAIWEEQQKKESGSDNKNKISKHIIITGNKMRPTKGPVTSDRR
jgi:hypothetical protein